MALILEFVSQQWMLVAALAAVVFMLFFHEARKSGPGLSPQQAMLLGRKLPEPGRDLLCKSVMYRYASQPCELTR